jgi:hypothetical protein
MLAVGVGHNEHSLSHVWRTNGASGNSRPFRIIPEAGQVSANGCHVSIKQRCDVFHDDVAGSYFANQPCELAPQSRSLASDPTTVSGSRNVLAGEATANNVGEASVEPECANVVVAGDIRPMLGEDSAAEGIDFAEGDGSHSGSFKPEAESADAGKEVKHPHLRSRHSLAWALPEG